MKIDVDKKALYFLRKIDDAGRIIIPRQIRELYNIEIGDTIEILCENNGQLVMKKHKLQEYFLASSEKIIQGFYNATGIPIVLCDRNEIIASKGIDKIGCIELSKDFFAQIRRKDDTVYPNICLNQDKTIAVKDFRFISHQNECIGAAVIPDNAKELNDSDRAAFEVCVSAIAAYVN